MAATIDSAEFILVDNWPTLANNGFPDDTTAPANGSDHNVASAKHPVGTKWTSHQKASTGINQGDFTLIYLKMGTPGTTAVAAKQIVCLETAGGASAAGDIIYTVTNSDATAEIGTGMMAVALSAITTNYYGWFWCKGVCPEDICAGLAGNHYTQGSVTTGNMSLGTANADAALMGYIVSTAGLRACGIAFTADA